MQAGVGGSDSRLARDRGVARQRIENRAWIPASGGALARRAQLKSVTLFRRGKKNKPRGEHGKASRFATAFLLAGEGRRGNRLGPSDRSIASVFSPGLMVALPSLPPNKLQLNVAHLAFEDFADTRLGRPLAEGHTTRPIKLRGRSRDRSPETSSLEPFKLATSAGEGNNGPRSLAILIGPEFFGATRCLLPHRLLPLATRDVCYVN